MVYFIHHRSKFNIDISHYLIGCYDHMTKISSAILHQCLNLRELAGIPHAWNNGQQNILSFVQFFRTALVVYHVPLSWWYVAANAHWGLTYLCPFHLLSGSRLCIHRFQGGCEHTQLSLKALNIDDFYVFVSFLQALHTGPSCWHLQVLRHRWF